MTGESLPPGPGMPRGSELFPELVETYREMIRILAARTRGRGSPAVLDRELEVAREEALRALWGALSHAQDLGRLPALVSLLGKQLLDYPPLVEDPLGGEIQGTAEALAEDDDPVTREEGRKLLGVFQRLQELARLRTPVTAADCPPDGVTVEELLELWPERPADRARDLCHRALVEYHKARKGGRRARHRGALALMELALATTWERLHPWRLALLEKAGELAPDLAEIPYQIARHLKAYGELAASRRACRRAIDADGKHVDALVFLGSLLETCARPREALAAYRTVVRLHQGPATTQNPGPERGTTGAFTRFSLDPSGTRRAQAASLEACARLGVILGEPGESLRAMDQLLELVPGHTRQLRVLECLARRANRPEVAARYREALASRGGEPRDLLPRAWQRIPSGYLARLFDELDAEG